MKEVMAMGEVHRLLEQQGRQAAIGTNLVDRDVLEAAHLYLSDEESALAFAYSGWAQCALPHRRLPASVPWEVKSDRMRLVVEPGRRPPVGESADDGPLEWVGVPFGAYARLILLYLQTQALRTGSREVELGRSWKDWMTRIGIPWGGESGRRVREQAELLSRCRLTFHLRGEGRSGLVNVGIVDRAMFLENDYGSRQGRLSLEVAKLSEGFFDALKKHPIPLEEAAIKALANNSAALDCYLWLAYRLHVLAGPRMVTWIALKAQHGTAYKRLSHFKESFVRVLALATAVYPDANVDVVDEGIVMKPSRPPVAPRLISIRS